MRLDTTDQYLFRLELVVENHDVGGTAGCERAAREAFAGGVAGRWRPRTALK